VWNYLEENGFEGLLGPQGDCTCSMDDLIRCESIRECTPISFQSCNDRMVKELKRKLEKLKSCKTCKHQVSPCPYCKSHTAAGAAPFSEWEIRE